jgi:hypothetical protein
MKTFSVGILACAILAFLTLRATSPFAADDVTERAVPGPPAQQPGFQAPTTPIPTMTVEQRLNALQQQN